ncbi:type VI secretion system lipoprotein TssJ [Achromobacter sp. AGC39]
MKRLASVVVLTTLLTACGTVGDVLSKTGQILMDPSIPIGPPDEQPSLVGLSLYAAADVNPNPASMPDDSADTGPDPASNREEGPLEVKLKSGDRQELIESLRSLLEELEEGRPSLHPLRRVDTGSSKLWRGPVDVGAVEDVGDVDGVVGVDGVIGLARHATAKPVPAPGSSLNAVVTRELLPPPGISPHYLPGRQFGSGRHVLEQGFSGVPLPVGGGLASAPATEAPDAMPRTGEGDLGPSSGGDAGADTGMGAGSGLGLGLGQYSRGASLPPADPAPPPRGAATPIAFKVLQLKDDSLLLNVDPEQLAKDLKKALGSTYITQDDYVLQPGQFKFIDFARIDKDTRYVAIVADFHDQNGAVWKQAFRLEPNGRRYALLMTLHGNRVGIVDESFRASQPRSQP